MSAPASGTGTPGQAAPLYLGDHGTTGWGLSCQPAATPGRAAYEERQSRRLGTERMQPWASLSAKQRDDEEAAANKAIDWWHAERNLEPPRTVTAVTVPPGQAARAELEATFRRTFALHPGDFKTKYEQARDAVMAAADTYAQAAVTAAAAAQPEVADVADEMLSDILRDILEALCHRNGLSLESTAGPGPARNYELADRLGIGHVFGLQPREAAAAQPASASQVRRHAVQAEAQPAPGLAELPPDPTADELRLAGEADQARAELAALRQQLARLTGGIKGLAEDLEHSAAYTAPSKKSAIETTAAERLRTLLAPP